MGVASRDADAEAALTGFLLRTSTVAWLRHDRVIDSKSTSRGSPSI